MDYIIISIFTLQSKELHQVIFWTSVFFFVNCLLCLNQILVETRIIPALKRGFFQLNR